MSTTLRHLATLEAAGLVRVAQVAPALEYLFRHALLREAAYHSLLKQQRRVLHQAAGEVLAAEAGLEPALLAQHFLRANNPAQALHYLTLAGDRALERSAFAEALAHYTEALTLALAPSAPPTDLLHLYTCRGRVLELQTHLALALEHYAAMEATARERGDTALELASLLARATIRSTSNVLFDPAQAQALLARARDLAQTRQEGATEAKILWNLLLLSVLTDGTAAERVTLGEQALALARQLNLREQTAFILTDIFYGYAGGTQWERAQAALVEARTLWEGLNHPPMLIETLGRLGLAELALGQLAPALAHMEESYALSCQIQHADMQALSRAFSGWIYWEQGAWAHGLAVMEAAIASAQVSQNVTVLVGTQAECAWAYAQLGVLDQAEVMVRAAGAMAEKFPPLRPWAQAVLLRVLLVRGDLAAAAALPTPPYTEVRATLGFLPFMWVGLGLAQGELALAQGQPAASLVLAQQLLHDLDVAALQGFKPETCYLLGCAAQALGQLTAAQDWFAATVAAATAIGSHRMRWHGWAALGALAAQQGDDEAARHWQAQARAQVVPLLAQLPSPWQTTFRQVPIVQGLGL